MRCVLAVTSLVALGACSGTSSRLGSTQDPADAGCTQPDPTKGYEVFFVIDVSGSMGPFLNDVRNQMVALAGALPAADGGVAELRIDYSVIGFVNDVKVYGGKMNTAQAVQAAFDQAIAEGATGNNLNVHFPNAEPEENALDALAEVPVLHGSADSKLVIVATDADFPEAPTVLSENLPVRSTYADVLASYGALGAHVHAFVPAGGIPGLSLSYRGQPALTTLPGSGVHTLEDLKDQPDRVRDALTAIARGAACN